jgi:transcriptional regulator with XRE-family HTH domain
MRKSIHSPEYQQVLALLVAMRQKAGLTQRDLAKKLGREHSFVWRIETGERRLDVIEFYWICQALGQDAPYIYTELIKGIEKPTESGTPAPFLIKAAEPRSSYRIRPGKVRERAPSA